MQFTASMYGDFSHLEVGIVASTAGVSEIQIASVSRLDICDELKTVDDGDNPCCSAETPAACWPYGHQGA